MDIAADGEKTEPGIDFRRKITLLIYAANVVVTLRIGHTIAPVDQTHDFVERVLQRLDQDMVMVRHKTPRQNSERIIYMDMQKDALQLMHILFRAKNRLPVIAAQDDVIIGTWIKFTPSRHDHSPHQ